MVVDGRGDHADRIDTTEERLAWALVVGTIPAVIVGAALENVIQEHLGQPWLIAVMFVAFGVVMFAKPGAGALAVLALIAAYAIIIGLAELTVAIGGKRVFGISDERYGQYASPQVTG